MTFDINSLGSVLNDRLNPNVRQIQGFKARVLIFCIWSLIIYEPSMIDLKLPFLDFRFVGSKCPGPIGKTSLLFNSISRIT